MNIKCLIIDNGGPRIAARAHAPGGRIGEASIDGCPPEHLAHGFVGAARTLTSAADHRPPTPISTMKAILRVPLIIVTFTTAADSVTSNEFPAEKGDAVSTDLVQPTAWEAKSKISAVLEREAAVFEDVEGLTDSVVEGRQLSDVCEDSTTWYQGSREGRTCAWVRQNPAKRCELDRAANCARQAGIWEIAMLEPIPG